MRRFHSAIIRKINQSKTRKLDRAVRYYAGLVIRFGVNSEQALKFRDKNRYDSEFIKYADSFDQIKSYLEN